MSKITYLGDHKEDNSLITPSQMIENALNSDELKAGKYNKAILILLDNKDDSYNMGFYASNMHVSEMLALAMTAAGEFQDRLRGVYP